MEKPRIGIIGGNGAMGRWLKAFFVSHGYEVMASDIGTYLTNDDVVQKCEVVVIAVPVAVAPQVASSISGRLRQGQLAMDVCAVKQETVSALEGSQAEIVSFHPMFSPTLSDISGQTVIVCDVRAHEWAGWIDGLFMAAGCKVKKSQVDEHDWSMAVVQGMTHFSLITLSHALMQLGVDIGESLEFSSPIYRIRLDMVGRVMGQDAGVYADIAINNPDTEVCLVELMSSSRKLKDIIAAKDRDGFIRYFTKAGDHLGDFRRQATEESDSLIRFLGREDAAKGGEGTAHRDLYRVIR